MKGSTVLVSSASEECWLFVCCKFKIMNYGFAQNRLKLFSIWGHGDKKRISCAAFSNEMQAKQHMMPTKMSYFPEMQLLLSLVSLHNIPNILPFLEKQLLLKWDMSLSACIKWQS